jgi:adenosylhomocysteine nucleosidase/futalosine hydrolase
MSENIVVVVPTEEEAAHFEGVAPVAGGRLVFGGVGAVETAATVARLLREGARSLILAGIAGAYESSGLAVGQSAVVGTERTADMGTFREGRFAPLFGRGYRCPHVFDCGMPVVESNSVSAAGSPYVSGGAFVAAAAIENMEGAAFFALCLDAGARFMELRTVSNMVGDPRDKWRFDLAAQALAQDLKTLLNAIAT